MLTYEQIILLHEFYLEVGSLEQSATKCLRDYGIQLNRQQLSRVFKQHGFYVKPPNGQPEEHWTDITSYQSGASNLATAILHSVYADLISPKASIWHKLTAAAFLGTERYELVFGTVVNASRIKIPFETLLPGVDISNLLVLREIYDEGYNEWVETTGTSPSD